MGGTRSFQSAAIIGCLLSCQAAWATPRSFTVDSASATLSFSCDLMGMMPVEGTFTKFVGSVLVDEVNPAQSTMTVTVDATSIVTDDGLWVDKLKGPEFFDVDRYPVFEFRATQTIVEAPGVLRITGPLTLKGITRPLTLLVRYEDSDRTIPPEMTAEAELDRHEFGMTAYDTVLDDEVEIEVQGILKEQAGTPPP